VRERRPRAPAAIRKGDIEGRGGVKRVKMGKASSS
jgi:hypothetical protein